MSPAHPLPKGSAAMLIPRTLQSKDATRTNKKKGSFPLAKALVHLEVIRIFKF